MTPCVRHRCWLVLAALLLAVSTFAQAPATTELTIPTPAAQSTTGLGTAVRFEHLTIEDGLSQNTVKALLQDEEGFLWMGTKDGLNRYDGYEFVVFRHDPFDAKTLSSSYVTALHEDDGYLWVGTFKGGLNRLDLATGAIVRYAHSPRYQTTAIAADAQGDLWIGTTEGGAYRLARTAIDEPSAHFEQVAPRSDDPRSLSSFRVTSILADRRGDLWIGTDAGLNRLDETGRGFVRHTARTTEGLLADNITALAEASDGALWVGTERGLSRMTDVARGRFTAYPYPAISSSFGYSWGTILQIGEGPDGRLWCALQGGLARFDPASGTYLHIRHDPLDPEGLSDDRLLDLLWDRSGVLWVGMNGYGLDRFDAKAARFQTIRRPPDLRSEGAGGRNFSVRGLFEDRDGVLWISAGAFYRYHPRTGTLVSFDGPSHPLSNWFRGEKWSMVEDRQRRLWFGDHGLLRYDPQTERIRPYDYDAARPVGLPAHNPGGVFVDRQGTIWAVTIHHISRLNDVDAGRFTHYRHTSQVDAVDKAQTPTLSVHEDTAGHFWMATETGLVRFDPRTGAVKRYRTDPGDSASLSYDQVLSILPDPVAPNRVLWIGTAGGGLNRFDMETETFSHVTERDGLPNNVVYGVLPDDTGRLWMSTNRGLARYDPASGDIRSFDSRDGLQGNEFNAGAYHRGASGRLYFGGIYGVNAFDPQAIVDNPHVPPVVLTSLRIGDRPVAVGDSTGLLDRALWATDELRLSHRENMVTLSFAALDFSAPAKNRYAYRMEGFDNDWIQAGTDRTATYTNLPPGRYSFRVLGTNNDGVWNEEGASLAVVVAPPPWRAWWAYLSYVLLGIGLLTAIYQARRRRHELRHRLELEQVEAEKLREVDVARSRFFANVSHEFRTPLTLTLGPLDDIRAGLYGPLPTPMVGQVDLARRNAARVLELINQILDVARLEAGKTPLHVQPVNLADFVDAVAQPFREAAARKALSFSIAPPVTPVEIYLDPTQFEHVIANLLSNAVKFTPEGGTVRVVVAAEANGARVTVRDSGPGIPAADLPHVFDRFHQVHGTTQQVLGTGIGLALAKEVVDLHGGVLSVASEEGFGSTFTVTLQFGHAHLAPDQIEEVDTPWNARTSALLSATSLPSSDDAEPLDAESGPPTSGAEPDVAGDEDQTTILVVEDHAEVRAYVRRHLETTLDGPTYRVLEAADGEAGLALARRHLPDLVLADVMMPGLDGFALCRALKADPATDFIPVVLLTAKAAPEDKLEGLGEQADDYLTKPFDPAELRARIANLISVRTRLRERIRHEGFLSGDGAAARDSALPWLAPPKDATSADDAFLERVRLALDAHLADEAFSVAWLADEVGVSRGHLHRQLKALAGYTPTDLIRTVRLERGAHLLRAGSGSVSEVTYAVGFKSVSHFSDSFLAAYGCRPSDYAAQREA